ncbi:MAG: transporter substrate-binding domain-containing protein, partial [Gammaproteobacteria bacterium]|nr:transporter substrate-binding domain-containing protein [Gammaproteobacteria bacterium]
MAQIYQLAGIIDRTPKLEGFIYTPPAGKLNLTYEELAYLKDKQVLNICVQKGWFPYEKMEGNQYQGILADFSHLIRDKTGLSIYPVPTDSSEQALTLTLQGICDITSTATQQTDTNNLLLFTSNYINIPLVYLSNKPMKEIALSNGKVAIATNSPYYKIIQDSTKQFTFVNTSSVDEALDMLKEGRVDAVIGSQAHIGYLVAEKNMGGLSLTDNYMKNWKTSFAMNHQHRVLHSILNKTLELLTPQEHDKIMSRWITHIPQQGVSAQTYLILIGFITLFSLFILYRYFSALLRSKILKELSETDQLTGAANRRKSLEEIQR